MNACEHACAVQNGSVYPSVIIIKNTCTEEGGISAWRYAVFKLVQHVCACVSDDLTFHAAKSHCLTMSTISGESVSQSVTSFPATSG